MKIIFIGTPKIAVPSLKAISDSKHEITCVITMPDKAAGRGCEVKFSPVKEEAINLGLNVLQPEKISDEETMKQIEQMDADLLVVVAYSQKIPERLLNYKKGCINLHPSLLPKYRGADPIRGPILNGDEKTGVSIMQMEERLDSGDILAQEEIEIEAKENAATLEPKLALLGAKMLVDVLDKIENNEIVKIKQNEEESTYVSQITKQSGLIDFNNSASYIERQTRALNPWPSAFTTMEGKTFKVWDADVYDTKEIDTDGKDFENGCVIFADKKNVYVKCQEGLLKLNEVQLEGKKRMNIEEFLRGKKIDRGFIFGR